MDSPRDLRAKDGSRNGVDAATDAWLQIGAAHAYDVSLQSDESMSMEEDEVLLQRGRSRVDSMQTQRWPTRSAAARVSPWPHCILSLVSFVGCFAVVAFAGTYRVESLASVNLRMDGAAAVPAASPPSKPVCLSAFYFVTGVEHSGTTAVQSELMRRTGAPLKRRGVEGWPLGCPKDGSIFKSPIISSGPTVDRLRRWLPSAEYPSDLRRLLALRDEYPRLVVVFMTRDIANSVWSLWKRLTKTTTLGVLTETFTSFATEARASICAVRQEWNARTKSLDDHTVRLRDFAASSGRVLDRILLKRTPLPSGSLHRKQLRSMPDSAHHAARRKWQAQAPIYEYQPDSFANQTSEEVAEYIGTLRC